MKKIYLVLWAVSFCLIANAQKFSLSDISLSKSDFEIKKGFDKHPYDAKIYTGIACKYKIMSNSNKQTLIIDAVLSVNSKRSWIKEEFWNRASKEQKEELLRHEKGHLIIALVQFKKFEQICTQRNFSKQGVKFQLDSISKYVQTTGDSLNNAYDEDTKHSRITDKQTEWITKLLNEFNVVFADDNKVKYKFQIEVVLPE